MQNRGSGLTAISVTLDNTQILKLARIQTIRSTRLLFQIDRPCSRQSSIYGPFRLGNVKGLTEFLLLYRVYQDQKIAIQYQPAPQTIARHLQQAAIKLKNNVRHQINQFRQYQNIYFAYRENRSHGPCSSRWYWYSQACPPYSPDYQSSPVNQPS